MFEPKQQSATITHVQSRPEYHGDKKVIAFDLKVEIVCHASVLDQFDPKIRELLYREPGPGEQQRLDMAEGDPQDKQWLLRVPRLKPLHWEEKYPGYTLSLHEGMGFNKPLALPADLSKFVFEALEGGSVAITFNASCHPERKNWAQLIEQASEKVELSLEAPKASGQQSAQADLADDSAGRERVLITAVDFHENKPKGLFTVTVTTTEGKPIACDPVAYRPDQNAVADLLRFKGYEPEFAPAAAAEAWPKAA